MSTASPHILLVEARFYEDLCQELARGAIEEIERRGGTWEQIGVPGALEIPGAVKYTLDAMSRRLLKRPFDGFVALGCVIRGETTHYDTVCNESARALMDLTIEHSLALGNGIQTVENREQAWARAKVEEKNKGGGAAGAALDMIALKGTLGLLG